MYPGGYQPSNEISQITTAIRGSIPSKPLVTTEAGYHNALNTTNGHRPVPEDVAGVYPPRVLLEHFLRGEKRVYTYELIDEFDDPGLTNPEAHFGLLRRDWSPKPAYTAMKNLLGLLDDPGPSFTPAAAPGQGHRLPGRREYVLTQKRNGQYVLLLWRDVSLYDPVTQQPQPVTPTNVTLQLAKGKNRQVYRPSEGTAPVTQTQGSSLPLQMDGSVTAITIDPIPAPAPESVSATAGNASATVTWQLPATQADVTGFEVTRQPGQTFTLPATARSFEDTGLTNGTSYTYSRAHHVTRRELAGRRGTAGRPSHRAVAPDHHLDGRGLGQRHRDLEGTDQQRRLADHRLPAAQRHQDADRGCRHLQGDAHRAAQEHDRAGRRTREERRRLGEPGVHAVRQDQALEPARSSQREARSCWGHLSPVNLTP